MRNEDRCLLEMDVIKAIDKHTREDGTLDDDISCILEEVESVDAEDTNVPGKWIPISERLPKIREDVLVTVKHIGFMGMYGTWIKTGHLENDNDWFGDCMGGKVIAWMPLPEPYREVTDEENLESRR